METIYKQVTAINRDGQTAYLKNDFEGVAVMVTPKEFFVKLKGEPPFRARDDSKLVTDILLDTENTKLISELDYIEH